MTKKFIYGQYSYQYTFVPQNRKTLSLTVQPDMNIVLKAPIKADQERINQFLKKKWLWLNKQLAFFKKYQKVLVPIHHKAIYVPIPLPRFDRHTTKSILVTGLHQNPFAVLMESGISWKSATVGFLTKA